MFRHTILLLSILFQYAEIKAQCGSAINSFPYTEGFEATDGGWTSGGAGNDWEWGSPSKATINSAGGGVNCWIVGGLTGSSYTNAEASWLQSPCFDFTNLEYPFISFKLNWETEQQFDGGSFQYSIDNGASWTTLGAANYTDCMQKNWFNQDPVTYLSPLTSERRGWSGNIQSGSGSCRGGNGSNGWVTASIVAPSLAGRPAVIFRFIFGAGTICNNYDGFAVDDIYIANAPPNDAAFSYTCTNNTTVSFKNESALCPNRFSWDFGDPASGSNNTSTAANPSHVFSGPGNYTIRLTVAGPGNAPSSMTKDVTILQVDVAMTNPVTCGTNNGGSLMATAIPEGALSFTWNTVPAQTGPVASNLSEGNYTVTVSGANTCTATAVGKAEMDLSCIGVFFPSAFTPDNNGRNDDFGPLGSLGSISNYQFTIYNRWGEAVFSSTNPYQKWDGTLKGVRSDGNVFVWQAAYNLRGQEKRVMLKGTVVLIR